MRIMSVFECLNVGGTEWQAVHILSELARRGWELTVVTLEPPSPEANIQPILDAFKEADIEVINLDIHRWNLAEGALGLVRLAQAKRIELLHGRLYFPGLHVASTRMMLPDTSRVVSFHNVTYDYPDQRAFDYFRKYVEAGCLRFGINGFAAVSTSTANSYAKHLHLDPIEVIPNSVPVEELLPKAVDRNIFVDRYGLRKEIPWILAPMRLVFEKGHTYLFEAADQLRREGLEFQIICVGRGVLYNSLKTELKERGLTKHVLLSGIDVERSEVLSLLDACDIVVLPSLFEGFPNAAAEALAKAKPLVGTTIGGFKDLVENGKTGLLVPSADAVSLSRALKRLLKDKNLRQDLGAAGRKHVELKFSVQAVTSCWADFYARVVSDTRSVQMRNK